MSIAQLRTTLGRRRGRLRPFAEHLLEVPAYGEIERQLGQLERRAIGTTRCLVDCNEARQARDQLMLQREREDGLVRLPGAHLPQGARDFGVVDLATRPEF